MIFFLNIDGTLEKQAPSRVFQGSSGVDKIVLISPFSSALVSFTLPTGMVTVPIQMSYVGAYSEFANVFEYTLSFNITKDNGSVGVSFMYPHTNTATNETEWLTSYTAVFDVEYSTLPENIEDISQDDVTEMLALLSDYYTENKRLTDAFPALAEQLAGNAETNAKAYANSAATAAETSSKSYADTKELSAIASANQYTDEEIASLETGFEQDLTAYATSIDVSMDSSTYLITIALKNSKGDTLSTKTVDLPLESMLVGVSYNESTNKLTLTLKNGQTATVDLNDLVDVYSAGTGLNLNGSTFSVKYGSSSGTACQGNDSRLSDARKNPYSLTINRNGTFIGSYDGSTSKTINISVPTSASDVGALPSSTVIGNGTITVRQNGVTKGTFSLNQVGDATIDLTDADIDRVKGTITLVAGDWQNNEQTVSITALTADSDILIDANDSASALLIQTANIYFASTNSTSITFFCKTTPLADIILKYTIFKS